MPIKEAGVARRAGVNRCTVVGTLRKVSIAAAKCTLTFKRRTLADLPPSHLSLGPRLISVDAVRSDCPPIDLSATGSGIRRPS